MGFRPHHVARVKQIGYREGKRKETHQDAPPRRVPILKV